MIVNSRARPAPCRFDRGTSVIPTKRTSSLILGIVREHAVSDEDIELMNIATKKCLSRRTFLCGVGATIALPLLDSMVPAFARASDTVACPIPIS